MTATVIKLSALPPSVNGLFFNARKGRVKTPSYRAWITAAGWDVLRQKPAPVKGQVCISVTVEDSDNRKSDIDNKAKSVLDLLVRHQLIEADDKSIVRTLILSWSKEMKGCEIIILPIEEPELIAA